jgi:hypothetical protein
MYFGQFVLPSRGVLMVLSREVSTAQQHGSPVTHPSLNFLQVVLLVLYTLLETVMLAGLGVNVVCR